MPSLSQVNLESYLLAQLSTPLDCLVCGAENCQSAERCCRCRAPVALARQAADCKREPSFVAVLGAGGVGKTVFLGMAMDMLLRRVGGLKATVRGPHSISLQQTATTALASGWYPEKTSTNPEHWHWVHCQVECGRRRKVHEIVLADIAGDAWAQEADRPGSHVAAPAILAKCAAVMVVADAERLHAGDHNADFVVHKLLSTIGELSGGSRRKADQRPLALVFTKTDACPRAADDPLGFAESHCRALLTDCASRFPNTKVFAASVAGASANRDLHGRRRPVPLRIEPRGVVEPFGWLLTQL